jgi:hypothetical protein
MRPTDLRLAIERRLLGDGPFTIKTGAKAVGVDLRAQLLAAFEAAVSAAA